MQHKVRVGKMDIGLRFQNRGNSWYFYSRGGTNRRSKVKLPDASFTVPPSVADQIGALVWRTVSEASRKYAVKPVPRGLAEKHKSGVSWPRIGGIS